ncbi:MAG: hypothetical protein EOM52_06670 [Clostridia bacterium]|nr:hypothetical protein [Clostridia bacterium]
MKANVGRSPATRAKWRANSERSAEFPQGQFICPEDISYLGSPLGVSRVGRKAHIGEVQASVWDKHTADVCQEAGVILL